MKHLTLILALSLSAAYGQKEEKKRSAEAHEHGSGKLGIAFEGVAGKFEWEIPLESLVGFEYAPTTPEDKKKLADAKELVKTKFVEMVLLPGMCALKVEFADAKFVDHGDHQHNDFKANGTITCKQAPRGDLKFAFQKFFPGIHKTKVQFLSDSAQTGAEILDDRGVVSLGN